MNDFVVLNVGDTAWFYKDGHQGEMSSGLVVGIAERYNMYVYVIEVETEIDPIYFARTSFGVSDAPDKPIGFVRFVKGLKV